MCLLTWVLQRHSRFVAILVRIRGKRWLSVTSVGRKRSHLRSVACTMTLRLRLSATICSEQSGHVPLVTRMALGHQLAQRPRKLSKWQKWASAYTTRFCTKGERRHAVRVKRDIAGGSCTIPNSGIPITELIFFVITCQNCCALQKCLASNS